MSDAIHQGHVAVNVYEKGIGTIEFSHPLSNSLPGGLLRELADSITRLGKDDSVKVIILKSECERAFCG